MSRDLVGVTLGGRYQLTALVGQGGMGAVYEARELSLGRIVAVKVLLEPAASPSMAERFFREAVAAARLQHVNIIQVTEFGPASEGLPAFIVMERLEGVTLASALLRKTVLPVPRALSIAAQTASALGAAHASGVVHRDIKPDNLFLQDLNGTDFVKVFDFGIAKVVGESHTTTGAILGTIAYMSPEQALAEPVGPPADVWSIGVVLFQMLSGRLPVAARGLGQVVAAILRGEMIPIRQAAPAVPDVVAEIVERTLTRDPAGRFRNGSELFVALHDACTRLGITAPAPSVRFESAATPRGRNDAAEAAETTMKAPSRPARTLEMPQAPKRPKSA